MRRVCFSILIPLLLAGSLQADPVLILRPSGDLTGPPGATLGWGFTITNDANYIEITSAQFCVNPVNFPLSCNSPSTGTFTDFISQFNDIIVGPPGGTDPDSVTQNFDNIAQTGIGSFQVNTNANGGDSDVGQIVLTYNVYNADPNGPHNTLASDLVLAANASVTIVTPEPGTAALVVSFILLAGFQGKRRLAAAESVVNPNLQVV